jgi:hypothetical protein
MKVKLEISGYKVKDGFESITNITQDPDNIKNSYLYHPEYYKFSGSITLTFTRPLYLVTGNERKIIVMGTSANAQFDPKTMVSAMDLIGGSVAQDCSIGKYSSTDSDGKFVATDTFVFTFKDTVLVDGSTFTFPSTDSTIASATSASTSQRVELTFNSRAFTGMNTTLFGTEYSPGFIVTVKEK